MWVDDPPRRYAWEAPRLKHQIYAAGTVGYLASAFVVFALPALRRSAFVVANACGGEWISSSASGVVVDVIVAAMVRRCAPLLAAVVVPSYMSLVLRDPATGNEGAQSGNSGPDRTIRDTPSRACFDVLPGSGAVDLPPVCAHCNGPLERHSACRQLPECERTGPLNPVTEAAADNGACGGCERGAGPVWACAMCGAMSSEASTGVVGSWAYGLQGAHRFDIVRRADTSLEYVESDVRVPLRIASSCDLAGDGVEPSASYIAVFGDGELQSVRLRQLGAHALVLDRLCEDLAEDWGSPILARRRAGYGARGSWILRAPGELNEDAYETDHGSCKGRVSNRVEFPWQRFSIASSSRSNPEGEQFTFSASSDDQGIIHSGLLQCAPGPPPRSREQTGIDRRYFAAQLSQQDGSPAGEVRLCVEVDCLVCQFSNGSSETSRAGSWSEAVAAIRDNVVLCGTCGMLSPPPSEDAPHVMKHCDFCNKCVPGFDHHCRCINQCVGRHNYRTWMTFVTSLYGLGLITSVTSGFALFHALSKSARHHAAILSLAARVLPCCRRQWINPRLMFALALAPSVALNGIVTTWLGCLLAFHAKLAVTGQTTMEAVLEVTSKEIFDRRQRRHQTSAFDAAAVHVAAYKCSQSEVAGRSEGSDERGRPAHKDKRPPELPELPRQSVTARRRPAPLRVASPSRVVPNRWADALLSPDPKARKTFSVWEEWTSEGLDAVHDSGHLRTPSRAAFLGAELSQGEILLDESTRSAPVTRLRDARRALLRNGLVSPSGSRRRFGNAIPAKDATSGEQDLPDLKGIYTGAATL